MVIKAIPENTHRFLQNQLYATLKKEVEIGEAMEITDPHSQTFEDYKLSKINAHNEVIRLRALLQVPIAKIKDQSEQCLLGSGVLLLVNGKRKKIFIDAACIGKSASISVNCQLAQAILGKKVGDKGSYLCHNTGKMIYWEILEIEPYTIAKGIFKNQNREQLQTA